MAGNGISTAAGAGCEATAAAGRAFNCAAVIA